METYEKKKEKKRRKSSVQISKPSNFLLTHQSSFPDFDLFLKRSDEWWPSHGSRLDDVIL